MDKGLRLWVVKHWQRIKSVSILGLVDKGLRQFHPHITTIPPNSFNPWFSG